MTERRKFLALIAERKHQIMDWLKQYERDHGQASVTYNQSTERGEIHLHNVTTPYIMIYADRVDRLRGMELMGFEVIGMVRNPEMVMMARTRIR